MKPRRLVINGLRSYRERTEIDFSEVSLFAIVGDTGAGKSSILEAIVFALYSAATWTKQAGELISDGMQTMTVEMQFEVDDREWLIKRSMSRSGYPPPIHQLSAVDDPTERYDQRASVDTKVEKLLGLSFEAFTSAVILPQGRFERLLIETPANRTKILKGIFRLEQLDEARELAKATAENWRPELERCWIERAALLPNPPEAAKDAKARLAEAEKQIADLSRVNADLATLERRLIELGAEIRSLDAEEHRLAAARSAVDPDAAVSLKKLRADLEAEATRLSTATALAVADEGAAGRAVETARQQGFDAATLARYRSAVDHARATAPGLRSRREDLVRDEAAITEAQAGRKAEDEILTALANQSREANEGELAADQASTAAQARLDALRVADSAARKAYAEFAVSERPIKEQREVVDGHRTALATDAIAEAEAADALNKAEADLEAARGQSAAAMAAHAHKAGDPCPVCARKLPSDWKPPIDSGLDEAMRVRDRCKTELSVATSAASEARQDLQVGESRLVSLNEQVKLLEERWESARQGTEPFVPGWTSAVPATEVLAGAQADAAAAAANLATLRAEARAAMANEAAVRAASEQRLMTLASRRDGLERLRSQIEVDEKQIEASVATLPDDLAVTLKATAEDFERVAGKLDVLDAAAAALTGALEAARNAAVACRAAEGALARRRREELDEPETQLRLAMNRLAAAVDRAKATVGEAIDSATPEDQAVVETERIAAVIKKAHASGTRELAGTEVAVGALFEKAGVADRDGLTRALADAHATRGVATADLKRAEHDLPKAKDLDTRITTGDRLIATLLELTRLLGDGAFVGYVVEARQRALLAIASAILIEMSGDRYGFAEDFRIVDRLSGQPRSPKTLSGGETFQASLALALGLVELAGRSGGRLSSLFLDEGFGTLDANALDEALEELERRAAAGRVIGVISHLRSIAERLEHVLRVDRELGGTQVRWITGEEAAQLADDDFDHLAGLTG